MVCGGMYRKPMGSIINEIRDLRRLLGSEVDDMTRLLAKTDPETYDRFLRYESGKYEVIDTPDYIKVEIDNFDFNDITGLDKKDLSGKCVRFIFLVDGMFTAEFEIPFEIVNNFNYVVVWARQKASRRKQLNNLEKEFKKET